MITTDFYEIFLSHPNLNKFFDGVFASDKIPRKIQVSHFIVVNTDPSGSIGQHWYALYRHDKNIIECFDSLGIDDSKKKFLKKSFVNQRVKELLFNTTQVQDLTTTTCGEFVLYFLFKRMHNQDLDYDMLLNEIFCLDTTINEEKVKFFFENIILKKAASDSE